MTCPECGYYAVRVLYFGLPMNLCFEESCHTVWGFWSWVPALLPIESDNGYEQGFAFMLYDGSYLKALWHWLFHGESE